MHEWIQTPETVSITISLPYRVDASKIDYTITECYIKLNIPDLKIIKLIDLFATVDPNTSKMILEDRKIIFHLYKSKEELWNKLDYQSTNKEEIRARRKVADEKLQAKIIQDREIAKNKKKEFEKIVIDQSIRIDEEKRKELRDKKTLEKTNAERELYSFIQEQDVKDREINELAKYNKTEIEESKVNDSDDEKGTETFSNNKGTHSSMVNTLNQDNESMHDNNNINHHYKGVSPITTKKQPDTHPQAEIRQTSNIKVNLTEKMIPHFAARESLSKEPPYPKSKKYNPEKNYLGQEIEERNPIWTKEKADNFFNNKDFRSAVNAYTKALDLDSDFHKCRLNRATSYLHLGEFDSSLKDLEMIQHQIGLLDVKEREDPFYTRIIMKCLIKQYAIYAFLEKLDEAIQVINKIEEESRVLMIEEKIWKKIQKDKEVILTRKLNEEKKKLADDQLLNKNFSQAKEIYLEILQSEPYNEKVLSNLSLIAYNGEDYSLCINYCSEVIKIIKVFSEKIRLRNFDNSFEIKNLLRRAKCYEALGDMTKAQEDIERIEKLEIKNDAVFEEIKEIKHAMKMKLVDNYKQTANLSLSKGEFASALEYYDKAVNIIKYSSTFNKIDFVKLTLNRISCLIKLSEYDKANEECSKVLLILSKLKSVAMINSKLDQVEQIKELEFLTYVKRAYVDTSLKHIDEAIKDYENALRIKPEDIKIKENLTKLRISYGKTI